MENPLWASESDIGKVNDVPFKEPMTFLILLKSLRMISWSILYLSHISILKSSLKGKSSFSNSDKPWFLLNLSFQLPFLLTMLVIAPEFIFWKYIFYVIFAGTLLIQQGIGHVITCNIKSNDKLIESLFLAYSNKNIC